MTAWFGSKNKNDDDKADDQHTNDQDKKNDNGSEENPALTVSDEASAKINELIGNAASPVLGIRILAEATSPVNPEYSLSFVQDGEDVEGDTVFDFDGFNVYVDEDSMPFMEDVRLDFVTSGMGGGFQIRKQPKARSFSGPVAEKLEQVIQEHINPALALHGGFVQLLDVKDSTAYIELGGGCKGCGMVDVTLKQGIETMIRENVPEITEILDATDHASGTNPYYQPSK